MAFQDLARQAFARRRPDQDKVFLCANDAMVLLHIHVNGEPTHQSESNTRSIAILHEQGLIDRESWRLTEAGLAVFDRILNLPRKP